MLLVHAKIATMDGSDAYGLIADGAISCSDGRIEWVGPTDELPGELRKVEGEDIAGRLVSPGLIDCHTHIVFGGNRANEFEMRLEGASYEEIAKAGGGILSTVEATRHATRETLLQGALRRVDALLAEGVCTIEVKSGYGLNVETELKMLRVARQIEKKRQVRVRSSFLGAHAVPPEYRGEPERYLADVCIPALDAAHSEDLVDAVDGFCERIAFSRQQIETVFKHALELRLPVKLHAEQLSNLGGARLAAKYGALSADHLEYADEEDAKAMANSGTVATLLPGAFYTLREKRLPPVDAFRKHDVAMAVATDCNPGSSPLTSLLLAMNMACTLFRMTPAEALAGVTRNAARALGIDDAGIIQTGKRADLAVWDVEHPAELAYRIGYNPLFRRIFGGKI